MYVTLARESVASVARFGDEAAGIAFASANDDETFVHELFVSPIRRRQGVGTRLLEQATSGAWSRGAIVDASDAAAQAFAIRHGFALRGVLLRCAGALPSEDDVLRLAGSEGRHFDVAPLDVGAHRFAIETLEREVRGTPLGADHAILGQLATGNAFFLNGEFVGYAYVWPNGRLGPLAASSSSYEEQIFAFAIAALSRRYNASWMECLVPGANVRILQAAVRCRLAVSTAWVTATVNESGDGSRYVACHPLLY